MCTTVSNRPAELKPITASLGCSIRLASWSTHKGVIEDGRRLLERDAVLAMILRGFQLVPTGGPPLRPFLRAASVLAAEMRRPPTWPRSASHAVLGNTEETRPGTLRSRSRLPHCRPPPRPRTSSLRILLELTLLRLGISLTGTVIFAGRYWDRTSGPSRVKRGYGAYRSTICEPGSQLQQAFRIT